jgi:hypothetical protein
LRGAPLATIPNRLSQNHTQKPRRVKDPAGV